MISSKKVLTSKKSENKERSGYMFGFNGQMKVNEWSGLGNHLDFGERGYDTRIARFLMLDPDRIKYPFQSPYVFANNSAIAGIDKEGKGFLYNSLLMSAYSIKSTVGIAISGGLELGLAYTAAKGMAVDYKGNVALFYSNTGGKGFNVNNTLLKSMATASAQVTINMSVLPFKDVRSLPGSSFSISAQVGADGLVGGASIDFSKGKPIGYTLSGGIGTPGFSYGFNNSNTTAVLLSQNDYKVIADTKWETKAIIKAGEMTNSLNEQSDRKEGAWEYANETEVVYTPVPGSKNKFEIEIKQKFNLKQYGTGKFHVHDNSTTTSTPTGIILEQVDKNTLKSVDLK